MNYLEIIKEARKYFPYVKRNNYRHYFYNKFGKNLTIYKERRRQIWNFVFTYKDTGFIRDFYGDYQLNRDTKLLLSLLKRKL